MKIIYLMYKSCSKGFIKEILLIIQMSITIVLLSSSLTPFVNNVYLEQNSIAGISEGNLYYTATFSGDEYNDLGYISQIEKRALQTGVTYHTSGYINGLMADIYFYNYDMFNCTQLNLSSGVWKFDENGVFIGNTLPYNSDDEITICADIYNKEFIQNRRVIGKLNSHDVIYDISASGTVPDNRNIAKDYSYIRNVNNGSYDYIVIVPMSQIEFKDIKDNATAAIIVPKNNAEYNFLLSENNQIDGHFFTINSLSKNSIDRLIKTYNLNLLVAILMVMSSLFGIGGYTYLKVKQFQKQAVIYRICGCSNRIIISIVIMVNIILTMISCTISLIFTKLYMLSEGYDIKSSLLLSFLYVLLLNIAPSIWGFRNLGSKHYFENVEWSE